MGKRKNKQNKRKITSNSFDRQELGHAGIRTAGELRRSRSLKADHKRNIAKQAGYPDVITLRHHYDMAYHNGLGSNLAFSIVNDTWRVSPVIYDGEGDSERRLNNPTEFEKAIDEHFERLHVWDRLKGLDKAQRPMRYGALMYVTSENESAKTTDKLISLPSMDYLVKLNVFHEAQLPVSKAVQNPNDVNYGSPIDYQIHTNAAGSTNEWENSGYKVDASRIFAYGEGALDGSIYGVPCNEGCFEALMDAAKNRMASSEGLYQNCSNRRVVSLPDNATSIDATLILDSLDELDNDIGTTAIISGTISSLQTTLFDPTPAWTIAVNECAAHHSKPMSIIIGQMTGVLASEENIKSWNREIMDRQEQIGNAIIKGFVNDLIVKFKLPKPTNKMNIVWRDLNESTAEQQVDLALKRAQTNEVCVKSRMQPVYSTEFIQTEAGAPVEEVVLLDDGGEDKELVDTIE